MQKLPSVRQLQYFVALEELGHFGRAAEASFVSQSAFSTAIQELEATLGAQLVERTNRKVTINTVGREVAVQARLCLRELQDMGRLARDRGSPLAGKLILGVIPTIGPFLLPSLLKKLRRSFPKLQLFLKEQRSDELLVARLELSGAERRAHWATPGLSAADARPYHAWRTRRRTLRAAAGAGPGWDA